MKRKEILLGTIIISAVFSAFTGPANDVLEITAQLCHFSEPIENCSCAGMTRENKSVFQAG